MTISSLNAHLKWWELKTILNQYYEQLSSDEARDLPFVELARVHKDQHRAVCCNTFVHLISEHP